MLKAKEAHVNSARKESQLERDACWAIREQYPGVIMKKLGTAGWPDRMYVLLDGTIGFIEFKSRSGELRLNQKAVIGTLTNRGIHVDVCKTVSAALAAVADTIRSSQVRKISN